MDIQPAWLIGVVVLTVLTVLLTGPGMWSEKWGWKTFERIFSRKARRADPPRPPGDDGGKPLS
jgi:hypothetical protein